MVSIRSGDESEWSTPATARDQFTRSLLAPFRIDRFAVSNSQFAEFVDATGWRTDAEEYGWSFVFGGLLPDELPPHEGGRGRAWWRQVMGAD